MDLCVTHLARRLQNDNNNNDNEPSKQQHRDRKHETEATETIIVFECLNEILMHTHQQLEGKKL